MRAFAGRLINQFVILALVLSSFPATAKQAEPPVVVETGYRPALQNLQQPVVEDLGADILETMPSEATGVDAAAMDILPPALSLKAEPGYLLPGKEIVLSWELSNWTDSLEGLFLAWELAPGFIPVDVKEGFDPATGKLVVPLLGLSGELRLLPPDPLPASASFTLRLLQKDSPILEAKVSLEPLLLETVASTGGLVQSLDSARA